MKDLFDWAQSPDNYNEGVNLLAKYHRNRQLINFLRRKENKFNRSKLKYEVEKLLKNYQAPDQPELQGDEGANLPANPSEQGLPEGNENGENGSNELKVENKTSEPEPNAISQPDLFKQKAELINQQRQLSEKMHTASEEDLPQLTKEILDVSAAIQEVESKIELMQAGATDDPVQRAEQIDKLIRLMKNSRSILSKAQKKAEKNPSDVALLTKIEKHQQDINHYKAEITRLQSFNK